MSIYPSIHPSIPSIHPSMRKPPLPQQATAQTHRAHRSKRTPPKQNKQNKDKTPSSSISQTPSSNQFRKQVPPAPAAPRVTRQAARHGQGDHASVALVVPPGSFTHTHTHMCVCVCVCERVYVITTNMCVLSYVWYEITPLLPSWCHVYLCTHDARERAGERERERERDLYESIYV